MSARFETDTRRAPAHWASYIFNADASGLDADDADACDRWVAGLVEQGWRITGTEEAEPWFARSNDAGTLACDIYTYELIRECDDAGEEV